MRTYIHILALLILSALLAGSRPAEAVSSDSAPLYASAEAMGTVFTIKMYGNDKDRMQSAANQALDEARRLDRMLSNYISTSELSRVNREAAGHPVQVSREFFNLLAASNEYSRASAGAFDITVGPLMKVWGFYKDSASIPTQAEVKAALRTVGYRSLKLDPAQLTVSFDKFGMNLDPGGIGKGYAVDRMVAILSENGIHSALVSAGGSSIYGLGAPAGDPRGWRIRIRDPEDETRAAAEVFLHDDSLSTSGKYEKFFWANGKLYSHIMDPRTGYPSMGMRAVSVMSRRTIDSEVWAKPFYIRGRAWTEEHNPKEFRVLMCEDKLGAACAWLP